MDKTDSFQNLIDKFKKLASRLPGGDGSGKPTESQVIRALIIGLFLAGASYQFLRVILALINFATL